DSRADRERGWYCRGPRYFTGHRRTDDRQDDLRVERLVRGACCLGHQQVPRGLRGIDQEEARPPRSSGCGMTAPTATTTVTLTIEGRRVTVPNGTTILEAAKVAGVLIPHYCYHPGLPVAGVCRMCLVDVEKAPKLAPSCATAAA